MGNNQEKQFLFYYCPALHNALRALTGQYLFGNFTLWNGDVLYNEKTGPYMVVKGQIPLPVECTCVYPTLPSSPWSDEMGVTCVCQWPVAENRTVQQTVEMLTRRVEVMGAAKTGNFCVDCETYQSAPTINSSKLVHLLHNSEQPASCFGITDTGAFLVADSHFEGIMQKLKGFYTPRKSARVESKGQRFELGDFIVKVGIVSIGPHTRGILVEVEYTPCLIVSDCWNLLTEFMQSFMGNQTPTLPSSLQAKQEMPVTSIDTVVQYLEHFNNFKKGPAGR